MASRCIPTGEEICHVYQGQFGDTSKEERQRILQEVFNFQCQCTACQNNYPLINCSPSTYLEMANNFDNEESYNAYFWSIKEKIDAFDIDSSNLVPKKEFIDMMHTEINRTNATRQELVTNILKMLDNYRLETNEKIKILVENKNIDAVLQLYYERQKLASIFLKQPHRMLYSGRAAITDCLYVKYGNISFDGSRNELFGTYM